MIPRTAATKRRISERQQRPQEIQEHSKLSGDTYRQRFTRHIIVKRRLDDSNLEVPATSPSTKKQRDSKPFNLSIGLKKEFKKFSALNKANDPQFFEILYKKIHSPSPMRASMAYLLFEYLKDESAQTPLPFAYTKFFQQQLPFILEAIISIQYYHNQILDGKAGVTTPEAVGRNLIIGNLLKDQLYRYIEQQVYLPKSEIPKLTETVRAIFEWVDIGQYIEKNCNTYEALQNQSFNHPFEVKVHHFVDENIIDNVLQIIKNYIKEVKDYHVPFLRSYLVRIYLTNATLHRLAAKLIADLLQIPVHEKDKIIKFATFFGLTSQIVNDNCDLIPSYFEEVTIAKTKDDAFCDLRNGNITLPIFINLIKTPNGYVNGFFNDGNTNRCYNEMIFFREFTENLSIYYSLKVGKVLVQLATRYINKQKETKQLLGKLSRAENNKYYRHYYNWGEKKYYLQYRREIRNIVLEKQQKFPTFEDT